MSYDKKTFLNNFIKYLQDAKFYLQIFFAIAYINYRVKRCNTPHFDFSFCKILAKHNKYH